MGDRFYKQQMDYYNIKSAYELGQLHRGEITKRDKAPVVRDKATGQPRRLLKADVIQMVNKLLPKEVPKGLEALTVNDLQDLVAALNNANGEYFESTTAVGRTKKPYIEEIRHRLDLPGDFKLDLTKLTIATLKLLINSIKG